MNYYELLGVEVRAQKAEIKARYKKLALKYHPDVNKEDKSEEIFKKISHAASILLDDDKRREYDSTLKSGSSSRRRRQTDEGYNEGFSYRAHTKNKAYEFTTKSSIGDNIEIKVIVELEDMMRGSISAPIPIIQACRPCIGIGLDYKGRLCQACMGTGLEFTTKNETIDITGYHGGDKICIDGEGHESDSGGKKGNLYVFLEEKQNPYYSRDGSNIMTEYPVSYFDYILGVTFDLRYFGKTIPVTIPPGYNKTHVTLKGAGLPYRNKQHETVYGDLIIKINITTPFIPDELREKRDELIGKIAKLHRKQDKK